MITPSSQSPLQGQFAARRPVGPSAPVRFGYSAPTVGIDTHKIGKFLKAFDFKEMATANIRQIQLIYAVCILSRIFNASERGANDLRETATRDGMGYMFWFFATPMMQRLFLKFFPSKDLARYRDALVKETPAPAQGGSLLDRLKYFNWKLNPLSRYEIPSTRQLEDLKNQALQDFDAGREGMTQTLSREEINMSRLKLENYYERGLLKWRRYATGLGWAATIGLLGIGIQYYNIYTTRKKNARKRLQAQQMQPPPQAASPARRPLLPPSVAPAVTVPGLTPAMSGLTALPGSAALSPSSGPFVLGSPNVSPPRGGMPVRLVESSGV